MTRAVRGAEAGHAGVEVAARNEEPVALQRGERVGREIHRCAHALEGAHGGGTLPLP